VLDNEKKMMHLSNIGLYKEAKVIQKQLKIAKAEEKEKNMSDARSKLLCKSQQLLNKHQREIAGIKKKHAAQRDIYHRQRAREFDMIEQRFINVWNDLDGKYKVRLIDMDRHSAVKKMNIKVTSKQRQVF
jgi:hypothetical protein